MDKKNKVREDKPTKGNPAKRGVEESMDERKKKESWSEVDGEEERRAKKDDAKVKK